jgi:hypothetical protein
VSWGSVPEKNLYTPCIAKLLFCTTTLLVVGILGVEPRLKASVQFHGMR